MNRLLSTCFVSVAFAACSFALPSGLDQNEMLKAVVTSPPDGFGFERIEHGVQIRVGKIYKNIIFYGPETVRVNANLGQSFKKHHSIVVVEKPHAPAFSLKEGRDTLTIQSAKLFIKVDKTTGALSFYRPDQTLIVSEREQHPSELKQVEISGAPTYDVKQTFTLANDESLYGLGQYNDRYMDYRGKKVLLIQTNIGIVVPLLISTHRYGIMWDAYSQSTFEDNADGATFWSESSPSGVDYYFIAGDSMDDVIAGYRKLTGPAPMFSKAFYGFFMSKERYKTQQQVIDVVKKFRQNHYPIDTIVQDWQYWGGGTWGGKWDGYWSGMIWNKERYPDPAAMAKTLHDDLHVKLMVSIWPSIGNDTDLARELDKYDLRFAPLHWISKKARIYDAFSKKGRDIYFKYIKKGLLNVGVDALWMDGTEVEVASACHDPYKVMSDIKSLGKNAMGDFTRYLNVYSLLTTKGTYEGQRATSNKRVFTLTRSAFTGQQRYAAMPWSGDTTASWDTLHNQIAGGLNVCMAGLPYWTQDTGGFFVPGKWRSGATPNPEYDELYARWNQFGIFNPIYRIHGTDIDREPYLFQHSDPELYKSLLDAVHLRYRLLPYIYSLAWQSTAHGYTMMRGMAMDFPADQNVRKLDEQFMFGPAFLVRPVDKPIERIPPPPATTIPADALTTPGGKPGVAVEYFEGTHFEKPTGSIVAPTVDETWPGPPLKELPAGLQDAHDFSARWAGSITMPEDGEYEIGAEGDDGVRVWLDGKRIVDDWSTHAMRWRSQRLTFKKGQKVELKIDYFQGGGGRGLRLGWKTPSMLAAEASAKPSDKVATYLPAGTWYDFWTNEKLEGGKQVERACPMNILPLYVRAGSIVPMGPVMQYATEKPDAPYEIRVYPGADATFTIYEDDGETYNYEKGQYATVELKWNNAAHTLTIGDRQGGFSGMVKVRKYRVVLATPDTAPGLQESTTGVREILYRGLRTVVKLQ